MTDPARPETPDWMPENPWACPGGELVLPYDATRDQWLEARKASIGASEIPSVFNLAKWKGADAYSVWTEKMGYSSGKEQTRAMARGLIMEKSVLDLWIAEDVEFPIQVRRRGLMRSKTNPRIAASLDFMSVCPEGRCVVEVKTQNDTSQWDDDEIPLEYQFQGQAQLFVSGRHHVHFIASDHRFEINHRVMYRDDALISAMVPRLDDWWVTYIDGATPPPVSAKSVDTITQRYYRADGDRVELPEELWFIAKQDQELADRIEELKLQRDLIRAQVCEVMGDNVIATIEGDPIAKWAPTAKIVGNTAPFRKANAALIEPFMEPTPTLNVQALVAEHPELLTNGTLRQQRAFKWTL